MIRLVLRAFLPILLISASTAHASEKVVNFALVQDPPQLDSTKASDTQSFFVLGHIMEGLTRTGKHTGELIPGVAERWTVDDKGATFYLRKNAKWSDGKPVTAKDFIFSWRKTVDPKTASEYSFIIYPIKNAEAINTGKMPVTALGVTAPDDYTLKIEFEKPCGYFLGLTAAATYFPIREDFYDKFKDRYGSSAEAMVYNGPFKMVSWVRGASLKMVKNPMYWDPGRLKIDGIDVPYITSDNTAQFNFFKDKKTDMIERLGKDDLPRAEAEGFKMKSFSDGSIWFMEFNFREGRVTRNANLRKAIQQVFLLHMSDYISRIVAIPGTKPGTGLIPKWVHGVKTFFRREYPYTLSPPPSMEQAKTYIAKARQDFGGKIPPIVWLTDDTNFSLREASFFQNLFKSTLDVDLRIDQQIFKQRLAKMATGDFDIVGAGWGPDFADPMTFADLKTSWNENNRGKYSNPEVDRYIRIAQSTTNQKIRMDAMAAAEKIVLDDCAVIPTYERQVLYVHSNRLHGVVRNAIGPDPDFTWATVK